MTPPDDPILAAYAAHGQVYDERANAESCWGIDTRKIILSIRIRPEHRTVVDVGCGTGEAILALAATAGPDATFVGVEPAAGMRARAVERTRGLPNVRIVDGAFERLPLASGSVDYLFSVNALHWSTDLGQALGEMGRVVSPSGEMDHFFTGRDVGREFIAKTSPIFLRYMGPKRLLAAARLRQSLTRDAALARFASAFGPDRVMVEERYQVYYDSVEGHMGWWVRIEPQLLSIPSARRLECECEVRRALATLETDRGVPYTLHILHARVRPPARKR